MTVSDTSCLPSIGELCSRICARRIEQSIICRAKHPACGYERLREQAVEGIYSTRLVAFRLGRNGAGSLNREIPHEYREPAKNSPLVLGEKIVAPIEHSVQGLVSRQRGSASMPEQAEAILEQLRDSTNTTIADVARGELDGECASIKSAADRGNDR